jgi:WD40 repeat protein
MDISSSSGGNGSGGGGPRILTGSKDKSVVLSTLRSDGGVGLTQERVFEFHNKVVKTVAWRREEEGGDSYVFASGGQDSAVFVKVIIML